MAADPSLTPYRKVQAQNEDEMRRILESTARAIEKRVAQLRPGIGGQVRAAQLRMTLAAIKRMQRLMWRGAIDPRIKRAMDDAEEAAETAVEAMSRVAYAALPEQVAQTLIDGLRAAAESGLKSDRARKRRELSSRVYRQEALYEGKIEDLIRQGLIANLSAKELASTVYKYVSPTTPGGVSYAAMRLARTEINNAFHERQLEGAKRPGVKAAKWNLSGSHRVPDLCNVYAGHGGNGHWAVDKIPDKPHPQCFCYLTYVTTPPEEFRAKLEAGDFDSEIDRRTRENMARMGQPIGNLTPVSEAKPTRRQPLAGQAAHDSVPKGLFKAGTMTASQRKALKVYETGWFMVIQSFLRQNLWGDPDYKDEEKNVTLIDEAMDGSVLPEPIEAWRGMFNSRVVFGDRVDGDLTGFTWDDNGYGSVTTMKQITRYFVTGVMDPDQVKTAKPVPDSIVMKVGVVAGVKALETSTQTRGSEVNGPQGEITLQRGTRWRVVKDNGIDSEGVRHIEVSVEAAG
jgi:hypothetical protein